MYSVPPDAYIYIDIYIYIYSSTSIYASGGAERVEELHKYKSTNADASTNVQKLTVAERARAHTHTHTHTHIHTQLDAANTATLERVEELQKQLATSENARRRLHNQVFAGRSSKLDTVSVVN
jgi:hypothetical protein